MEKEIKNIIKKYLKGNCSDNEKKLLDSFLDSYQESSFNWKPEYGNKEEIEQLLFYRIEKDIQKETLKRKYPFGKPYKIFKYAAVLVLFIGVAILTKLSLSKNGIITNPNQITLKLSDGSTKILTFEGIKEYKNKNGIVESKLLAHKLIYSKDNTGKNIELSYNELKVPYSKIVEIELSDGTTVFLNSGSSLRYPVQFIKGKPREVYLDGEAYFKVSKDSQHKFKVYANDIVTEVFGTEFNVSSYKNDDMQKVVLVEGSVGVSEKKSKVDNIMMMPNQMVQMNNLNSEFTTIEVDVHNFIAWKDNVLLFSNLRFENVIKKLERHYDVSITNNYQNINNNRYTGTFEVESIEQVLNTLSKIKHFSYVIDGKTISINQ